MARGKAYRHSGAWLAGWPGFSQLENGLQNWRNAPTFRLALWLLRAVQYSGAL